ncbi:acyl carrier protein [Streptomyces sp. V4-01]|uniref:Acyl carrier protein n=1 Tax=Actinacidiphila polyblastidii TaxID=3110430 RepID=A0ABU7P9K5_9ACTN|nr:acyl carrier protein [Streptomyces sp. V4-01]
MTTTQQTAVERCISGVLVTEFKVDPDTVTADATFSSLKFDSLVLIELTLVLEKELEIAIPDGGLTDDMTIGQAAAFLTDLGAAL